MNGGSSSLDWIERPKDKDTLQDFFFNFFTRFEHARILEPMKDHTSDGYN